MGYDDSAERTNVVITATSKSVYAFIRCTGYAELDRRNLPSSPVAHAHLRENHSRKVPFCARWFATALFVAATRVTTVFDIVPGFGETFAPRKRTPTGDARLGW